MSKIYVTVGPPCSGKSTWAKARLKEDLNLVRVNKDSYRYMYRNEGMTQPRLEKFIDSDHIDTVKGLLALGYNVIIDNTHCKIKYVTRLKQEFKDTDIEVVTFDVPYWKLIYRNVKRYITTGVWIPKFVIKQMQTNFQEVKRYLEEGKC